MARSSTTRKIAGRINPQNTHLEHELRRHLQTLLRSAIKRAEPVIREELKLSPNQPITDVQISRYCGMSTSSLSRFLNAKTPIDLDRLTAFLEQLQAPDEMLLASLQLVASLNASSPKTAACFYRMYTHQLDPELLLARSAAPVHIIRNVLSDLNIDVSDKTLRGWLRTHLASSGSASPDDCARLLLELSDHVDQDASGKLQTLTLGRVRSLVQRYARLLCVDFPAEKEKQEPGVTGRLSSAGLIDFLLANVEKDASAIDEPHDGLHMLFLMSGQGVFSQWHDSSAASGSQEEIRSFEAHLEDGVQMSMEGRRIIVFDAAAGRHGFRAVNGPASLLVVTVNPRPTLPRTYSDDALFQMCMHRMSVLRDISESSEPKRRMKTRKA